MNSLGVGALVLYKQTPAVVESMNGKIEIRLGGGKSRSVREKDIVFLHSGPVVGFPDLESGVGEGVPEEAWELLQGESPDLGDLAELVYGEYSPGTAWMAFKLLNRTPWFRGTPDSIEVVSPEDVRVRIEAGQKKAEAERAWLDFLERFKGGRIDREGDEPFLRDLEMFALGRSKGSRILKWLKKAQTPENAHRVMLAKGVVDSFWNPHPLRLNVPLDVPSCALGECEPVERLDLGGVEAFAIDDVGVGDPDDAVGWDGERFWVHVADVAGAVPAGSEADELARDRVSNLYLPEMTVPMLPVEAVARFGLGLEARSPALSYAFGFDGEWNVVDFSIHVTTVRVVRISYGDAEERLGRGDEPFVTFKRIADAFCRRRMAAGAVSITMPEVSLKVGDGGEISIRRLENQVGRDLVGESMLMAGAYAAAWCRDRAIPVPYAVQDVPEQRVDGGGRDLDGFAAEFAKRRGMKRSRTTLEPGFHAGLGLDCYCRVTSPLRRYQDLIASRQIRGTLLGLPVEGADEVLAGLAAVESKVGSLIQAERRSVLFWKLQWLSQRGRGFSVDAVLLDTWERQGIFLVPDIALEVRVPLPGVMNVGDSARLGLKSVDVPESSVVFVVEE